MHSSGGETPESSAWQLYGRLCTDHCLQQSVSVLETEAAGGKLCADSDFSVSVQNVGPGPVYLTPVGDGK